LDRQHGGIEHQAALEVDRRNAIFADKLRGLSNRVRAYASSGTLRDPGAMAEAAERYLARGFPALKLRFHRGDWRDDVKALEAVRTRVGQRLELMVDCNQGWRLPWDTEAPWTLKEAVTVARELERLGVWPNRSWPMLPAG
jgi:L-alanine-DL-glutamate epimerase-like enolase superfamily enzyme